jgi:hypothetical protein
MSYRGWQSFVYYLHIHVCKQKLQPGRQRYWIYDFGIIVQTESDFSVSLGKGFDVQNLGHSGRKYSVFDVFVVIRSI